MYGTRFARASSARFLVAAALLVGGAGLPAASAQILPLPGSGGLCRRCPSCGGECCELSITQEKEERTCFKVEEKTICVPQIQLPWCCGRVRPTYTRKIRVLVEESYECPVCHYEWKVVSPSATDTTNPAAGAAAHGVVPSDATELLAERAADGDRQAAASFGRDVAPQPSGWSFGLPLLRGERRTSLQEADRPLPLSRSERSSVDVFPRR